MVTSLDFSHIRNLYIEAGDASLKTSDLLSIKPQSIVMSTSQTPPR